MNTKNSKITEYLNKVDTQELSYSQAREALLELGYSDEDIALAVSNHEPTKPIAPHVSQPDAATVAIAKAKLGFVTDNALRKEQVTSIAAALIIPNRHGKSYFFGKFLKNHADAKDLAEHGKLGPAGSGSLHQRYRLVKYSTWTSVILLVPIVLIAGTSLLQLASQLYYEMSTSQTNPVMIPFYLLALTGWIAALSSPLVLFFAKKESTLRAYIIGACIVPGILGVALGLFIQSYPVVAISVLSSLFSLWQAGRVGILSVLQRK